MTLTLKEFQKKVKKKKQLNRIILENEKTFHKLENNSSRPKFRQCF